MDIGARIRSARKSAGMSQADLAEAVYDDRKMQPAISRLEAGEHDPKLSTLGRIAEALGATLRVEFEFPDD